MHDGATEGGMSGAKGQVQKAFQPGPVPGGGILWWLIDTTIGWAEWVLGKLTVVRLLLPGAKFVFALREAKNRVRRAGVLETFKSVAEKRGVPWRDDVAKFESRGTAVWEAEKDAATDPNVVIPEYYQKHGIGTLHSYDQGNSCWAAAFDAPSAYLLVHLHHYPNLTSQQSFDQIHDDMHTPALARIERGSRPLACLDIGCGVGTSTFALRSCLVKHGHTDASILGVDLSTYFVAVARYRNSTSSSTDSSAPAITFRHGDGSNMRPLGVADASFDYVCMSEVTHELPQHITRRLLAEVARVLRPGGVLAYLVSVHVHSSHINIPLYRTIHHSDTNHAMA